jgi:DNA-binding NtrC family response regulator
LSREKRFRTDLYFRINTIPLSVPSLRSRAEDIPALARYLLDRIARPRGEVQLSPDAIQAMQSYHWPGNIRELRNVLERAVLLSDHQELTRKDLRFDSSAAVDHPSADDLSLTLQEIEERHIRQVLDLERGNVDRAAIRLGIPRSSLYQKIKKYRIVSSRI